MSLTKTGAGTQILMGSNTYSGDTTISAGKLVLNGSVASNSVVVASGASLGGSGVMANATLSGGGSINPGNSPGILTVAATDPTGGLSYNFEFTAANTLPAWASPSDSINDVLRLTSASDPFTVNLTDVNAINLYLGVGSVTAGDVFTGGFFTDRNADFLGAISSATFNFFIADNSGTISYLDQNYTLLDSSLFSLSTVSMTADFGSGNVNGFVTQFTVIPEPSVTLLGGLGALALLRRRRKNA